MDSRSLRVRAQKRPGIVKASRGSESKRWARGVYHDAVLEGGGYSVVAEREGVHESTVRDRCYDEREDARLSYMKDGLGPDGLKALAEAILDEAERLEALGEMRRAG